MDIRQLNLDRADPNKVLNLYHVELRQNHATRITMIWSGVLMIFAGFAAAVLGFGDVVDFDIQMASELASRITNASPGVLLMLFGLILAVVPVIYIRDRLKLNG